MKNTINLLLTKLNKNDPIVILDVGAMGGAASKWNDLSDYVSIIGFEPDEREFAKLKNTSNKYLDYLLYSKSNSELELFVTKEPGKTSILKPDYNVVNQFVNSERFEIVKRINVNTSKVKDLDSLVQEGIIKKTDFIKIDTQGSELSILQGGTKKFLPNIFGLQIEVEFVRFYENQPLFRDVDEFLDNNGFQLVDLRRFYNKRNVDIKYMGKGQIVFADGLYFKKIDIFFDQLSNGCSKSEAIIKIYKSILICLVYGVLDYAVDIVKHGYINKYFSKNEYDDILSYIENSSLNKYFNRKKENILLKIIKNILMKFERYEPQIYIDLENVSDKKIGNILDL